MKRPGFVVAGIAMIAIVGIAAVVSIALNWSNVLEEALVSLTTDMPTFEYEVIDGEEVGNASLDKFVQLRGAAFGILVGVIMFGGITLVFEKVSLVSEGTAWKMVTNGFVYLFFLMMFPWIWDLGAQMVEEGSKWIIDPDGNIYEKPKYILNKVTGNCASTNIDLTAGDFAGLDDPWRAFTSLVGLEDGEIPEEIEEIDEVKCNHIEEQTLADQIVNVFLTFTSSFAVLMLVFMTFIIGTGRIVLTDVFMVGFPIIMMLSLIPQFSKVTDHIKTGLVGLFIVPVFSALAITGGAAFLETTFCESAHVAADCVIPDALSGWFYSIAVLALITFMPVIIVPMLGSFANSMSTIATGSVMMGGLGAMQTIAGAGTGMANAARGISAAGGISQVGLGSSSLQMAKGAIGSGIQAGGMSAMGTMGSMGSAGGFHLPKSMMHAPHLGVSPTGGSESLAENVGMKQAGGFEQNFANDESGMAPSIGSNNEITNNSDFEKSLSYHQNGEAVLGDKKQTQSFLDANHTKAYENMSRDGQTKFDSNLLNAAKNHPSSVGKFMAGLDGNV